RWPTQVQDCLLNMVPFFVLLLARYTLPVPRLRRIGLDTWMERSDPANEPQARFWPISKSSSRMDICSSADGSPRSQSRSSHEVLIACWRSGWVYYRI